MRRITAKPLSLEAATYGPRVIDRFEICKRRLCNNDENTPAKFQSDTIISTHNLAARGSAKSYNETSIKLTEQQESYLHDYI